MRCDPAMKGSRLRAAELKQPLTKRHREHRVTGANESMDGDRLALASHAEVVTQGSFQHVRNSSSKGMQEGGSEGGLPACRDRRKAVTTW
jgi:hypothetical protein